MFTCISCRVAFDTAPEQRSHFSTDWHRYNMKRRVANLPPLPADSFNAKVVERREQYAVRLDPKEMTCQSCNKTFASDNAYRSHLQSRRHRDNEGRPQQQPRQRPHEVRSTPNPVDSSSDSVMSDEEIEDRLAATRRRTRPTDCLFCTTRTASTSATLSHMASVHSFFLPCREQLVDLPGLLAYLGEKVAVGNICLFCPGGGKEFGSLEAVRHHMIDKSHCKVAFESEEDKIELSDFYRFVEEEAEGSDWEDVHGEDSDVDIGADSQFLLSSDGLSLHLPNGRTIGHRSLRVYYQQKLKSDAAKRSTISSDRVRGIKALLKDSNQALVPSAGGLGSYGRGLEVMKARNPGEAKWARKQGRSFFEQRRREDQKTRVGFVHNSQKHFRDPLLQ